MGLQEQYYEKEYQDASSGERALSPTSDWSPAEERKAKRKLDLIILPLLTLGFFCLQLDRGNIANAITDSFREDINITQDQFNVGQQMLSLGIVLFEIPSNMILYRVGPGKWLTLQLFLFDQSRLVDIVNLVHSQGNSQTSHDLLLWQPIWPGFRKAFGVWYITHARCRRQTWMVLALRSHGGFHHSVRFRARFPPTRLVRKPSQRFPAQMAHLLRA